MNENQTKEIVFKYGLPLVVQFMGLFVILLGTFVSLLVSYHYTFLKFGLFNSILCNAILFGMLVFCIASISGLLNKRTIKINDNIIKIRYSLPIKKNLELNLLNCLGTYTYTTYESYKGTISQTKGIYLKFNNNYLLKIVERFTDLAPRNLNNLMSLYKLLESKKIKNFNNSEIDCIYDDSSGGLMVFKIINPMKLAKKAFLKGEYKLTYEYVTM